jgi:hypothetical protein
MKELKVCDGHQMHRQSDGVWRWDAEPSMEVPWMGHVTNLAMNCLLEEVALEKKCEDCPILSPFGALVPDKHEGNISQHNMTLIWKTTWQVEKSCELKIGGVAANSTLYHQVTGDYRLRNEETQSDFLVRPFNKTHTQALSKLCGMSAVFYEVLGMNRIVVSIMTPSLSKETLTAHRKTIQPAVSEELELAIRKAGHTQYLGDIVIDQENVLVRELQYLQYEIRKNQHAEAIATAQYKGWSAAARLQLPRCAKLQNIGNNVIVIQCQEQQANFSAKITACGPQPIFENST